MLSWTALPNLHPAVVHLPLALWPVAVGLDFPSLLRRQAWLDRTALSLYVLGALGAAAAYLAGEEAEESLRRGLPQDVASLVDAHAAWAAKALWTIVAVTLARLGLWWRQRRDGVLRPHPARWLDLIAGVAAVWLLLETADRGGALVYRHGVAVTPASAPAPDGAAR